MYGANDLKWGAAALGAESGPILWTADLTGGLDYDDNLYDLADFDAALAMAFDAWESVAAVDFEETGSAQEADLDIDLSPLSGSTVGYASIFFTGSDPIYTITSGSIDFDSTTDWAPFGETATNFYAVALHEIGHILGLDHVNDPTEIMNPFVSASNLGDRDIETIQYLYGTDPEDGETPPDVPEGPGSPPSDVPFDTPGTGRSFTPDSDTAGGANFFDSIFGWLIDLIASIFGGGSGDDVAEGEPLSIVPPRMTDDVVLVPYTPGLSFEEHFLYESQEAWEQSGAHHHHGHAEDCGHDHEDHGLTDCDLGLCDHADCGNGEDALLSLAV